MRSVLKQLRQKWRKKMKILLFLFVIMIVFLVFTQAKPLSIKEKKTLKSSQELTPNSQLKHMNHLNALGNPQDGKVGDLKFLGNAVQQNEDVHDKRKDVKEIVEEKQTNEESEGADDDKEEYNVGDDPEKPADPDSPHVNEGAKPVPLKDADDIEMVEKHNRLKFDDLQPDHLDAVKLEQDGHLNRDYKKEIFLGNHEEIEQGTEKERKDKLKDIFSRADRNKDNFLSQAELEEWIIKKVQEHLDEAHDENRKIFQELDINKNGYIEWNEFHIQFLVAKGHSQIQAEKQAVDYETIPLKSDDKEHLIRYKFRWAEADEDPQDNKLNPAEFKAFRHPEQSKNMLTKMIMDILENLDRNKDGHITEDEFAALPPGKVDESWQAKDKEWQIERRHEFKNVIDLDRNGKVTKEELKIYVDPSNPNHASLEAKNLVIIGDLNKDGKLSLSEVLDNYEMFLGSKMVYTGRSFHDEF